MDQRTNCRTLKLLNTSIGENLVDLELGRFLQYNVIKNWLDFVKIKNCSANYNVRMKIISHSWKKTSVYHISDKKKFVPKYIRNYKKSTITVFKMGSFTTHFTKDIGVANKHVKIYSTLVSTKIQIKTTMRPSLHTH